MAKGKTFTALYERLSHDDELQGESNSISHQKQILEEYAQSHELTPIRHFTDDGISGTRFDRPGFIQMMNEVKAGNIGTIIIKDMSRLGRDYLVVGQIQEMLRQKGVRLISINDNHDSSRGDDDFLPFRNIMNEWYAKDTSKKIKSVFQAKGRAGKHVASCCPYGYIKDKDDHNQWLIDEEAAAVVRRIYKLTLDGLGPYQIACLLEAEQVDIPAVHQQKMGMGNHQCRTFEHPYRWSSAVIVSILERREYLGHTVNFKTRKHFKDTHSHYVDADLWQVFENTQEPIIDQETFDLVQKIRQNVTRWPNGWGPVHPLTGLVYCADCGGKLYCHRVDNGKVKGKFTCGNYPPKKCKSAHRIDADDLVDLVRCTLKAVRDYIEVEPEQFIKTVQDAVSSQQTQDVKGQKKRLTECNQRMEELEKLLCKIYEDNALGKLPDKRYQFLSHQYESEMSDLEQEVLRLQEAVDGFVDGTSSAKKFMALIHKYQDFDELTNSMANELIDKIVVHERDRKGSMQSPQRVDIYFSFIGSFVPPAEPVDPEVEAAREAERAAIEAKKDRLHQNYLRRKANGSQRKYEERYKPIREARKRELMAALPKHSMTVPEYYAMRAETRTELDMPEGRLVK